MSALFGQFTIDDVSPETQSYKNIALRQIIGMNKAVGQSDDDAIDNAVKQFNDRNDYIEWNDGMGKQQENSTINIEPIISTMEPGEILGYDFNTAPTISENNDIK